MENIRELKYKSFLINAQENKFIISIELENGAIMNFTKSQNSDILNNENNLQIEDKPRFNWDKLFCRLVIGLTIVIVCFALFLLILDLPTMIRYLKFSISDDIYYWKEILGLNKHIW